MKALDKMYGQPHQLALQRIAELMDGANIRSGDVKAFRMFGLQVRSLVSMLQQLGHKGTVELECGSHVSRLLSKLPHDLRLSFKRYIHPLQVSIPTLLDFADWLEYELQVQEDNSQYACYTRQESSVRGREVRRESKQLRRPTTILLGTDKSHSTSMSSATSKPASVREEKVRAYCPYCDNNKHYLNGCDNFKLLSKDLKIDWIKTKNRCWRCGRGHQAANCTLKTFCPTCNKKHLMVLHDVNDQVKPSQPSAAPSSAVLYVDRPTSGSKVLLKVTKVLIKNGNVAMEAYAILDDGSERTIILHDAVQKLRLVGEPEDLVLRTVRQDTQVIHGAAVTFTVSQTVNPSKAYKIRNAFTAKALGLAEHTHPVSVLQQKFKHLAGLPLQQLDKVHPVLLIGSDCPHLLTPIEPVRLGPPGGPAAVRTRLGWTLQGPTEELSSHLSPDQCFFTTLRPVSDLYANVERLWQMDVLPYQSEKVITRSRQDKESIQRLQENTVRVDVNGVQRYATPLLRVKNMPRLCAPKEAVLPQLRGIEKRLERDTVLAAAYQGELAKLVQAGYVVKLSQEQVERTKEAWYIPHHMVQHNGKNRVVFNCSFSYQGHNLNELLLPGPTLGPSLLAVLLRFREHSVAISSDIRGMFHQVRLLPQDKPLLRYIWRDMQRDRIPDVYESKIVLFGSKGHRQFVRRPPNSEFKPQYTVKTVKHGGASIMIWACFSYYGVGPIYRIPGIMDQFAYVKILEEVMLPYAEEDMPLKWLFQQDNDPKHTSKRAKSWFQTNKINVMEWPAQSPDLNPIENLWGDIKNAVSEAKPRNVNELWNVVKESWSGITAERCHKLVDSMPHRCQAVLKNCGHTTKY
uniref:Tc1-like transposase DDE domain-containing protein n=3 Tax=Cyprinus carpio TaxID=7962 RepID=A0A9J8D9V3_CYPCA